MTLRQTTLTAAAALAVALTLTGCYGLDSRPVASNDEPTRTTTPASQTPGPGARPLAAPTATQTEWCRLIDASWDAYFGHGNDDLAVALLRTAEGLEPESFGSFEDAVHTRRIDRDVRFIGGGPDSQFIEYTTSGCWDWSEAVGADLGTKATDPEADLAMLVGMDVEPAEEPYRTHALCSGTIVRYDLTKPDGGEWFWDISGGQLKDTGTAHYASGSPNAELTMYTVAAGDTWAGIGDRFCVDHLLVGMINRDLVPIDHALQAEQTIRLAPADNATEIAAMNEAPRSEP